MAISVPESRSRRTLIGWCRRWETGKTQVRWTWLDRHWGPYWPWTRPRGQSVLGIYDFLLLYHAEVSRSDRRRDQNSVWDSRVLYQSQSRLRLKARRPIYKISYDNLMIILRKCRSCGRLKTDVWFAKKLTKNARLFSGTIHMKNHKIVWDSVRKLTRGIPRKELSTL